LSDEILKKLENLAKQILEAIRKGEPPKMEIPVRTLSNTIWDPKMKLLKLGPKTAIRDFFDLKESRKFMQTVLMLKGIIEARRAGIYPTIRNLYYYGKFTITYVDVRGRKLTEETWEDQRESNSVIQDIEVMTGLLREHMGIVHDAKGKMVGDIRVRSRGVTIDCSRMGEGAYSIPPNPDNLEIIDFNAKYVLVVEKDAIFNSLNMERFWEKEKCILITGKGQPDRSTRRMVRRLWEEYGLPVYVLTDSDPYGFYIYSVYKSGSISLSYESERLATPEARFIGVTPSDIYKYKLPKNAVIKAKDTDIKRAKELLKYPWFQSEAWQRELKLFLKKKEKAEIDALASRGFDFLSKKYIPEKIKKGEYIE